MIELSQEQNEFCDNFFKFLLKDNVKYMTLSGPAGVGKSTVISHIKNDVIPRYIDMSKLINVTPKYQYIYLTATTNKAAAVLSESTNEVTSTIHNLLGLTLIQDFDNGSEYLRKVKKQGPIMDSVIFIDECSMIDRELMKWIEKETYNSKVVFIGDHCQLPPVKEKVMPAFNNLNNDKAELNSVIRNKDEPALQALCNQLRNTVLTGSFDPIKIVPGVVDLFDDETLQEFIKTEFEDQHHNNKIVAYSNRRVNQFNSYIRTDVRGLSDDFNVGETLLCNTYIKNEDITIGIDEIVSIDNKINTTIACPTGDIIECTQFTISNGKRSVKGYLPNEPSKYKKMLKHFSNEKNWKMYFQYKDLLLDLRPQDSSTIHKSQGSTYDTVIVDVGDINLCNDRMLAARLLYVAVSRAKKRVILYGSNKKYGGYYS